MYKISIVIPAYVTKRNVMLQYYQRISEILPEVEAVIVDDGSPVPIESSIRLSSKIPWNQPAASNIGVRHAKADYILRCDLDHFIPVETLMYCLNNLPEKGEVIKFKRTYNGREKSVHKNIFLIHKSDYGEGYDEDFCGHYGNDDTWFFESRDLRERVIEKHIIALPHPTHNLKRNKSRNDELLTKKRNAFKAKKNMQSTGL